MSTVIHYIFVIENYPFLIDLVLLLDGLDKKFYEFYILNLSV